MKKIIASLSLVAMTSMVAFGQGQIAFANGGTSLISTNATSIGGGVGATAPLGTSTFYYALFYSTSATTLAGMTQLGPDVAHNNATGLATNTATAGRMTGGTGSLNAPALTGIAGGTAVNFILVGWSSNLGSTYAVASQATTTSDGFTGFYGVSGLGTLTVGGGGGPVAIPTLMGTTAGLSQITGFTLNAIAVPEPGTMALAALGGASLLLFRRKK